MDNTTQKYVPTNVTAADRPAPATTDGSDATTQPARASKRSATGSANGGLPPALHSLTVFTGLGDITLVSTDTELVGLRFGNVGYEEETEEDWEEGFGGEPAQVPPRKLPKVLLTAAKQLQQYFDGKREVFTVPLNPGGTPFQQRVWEELTGIPFGETRTYGQIAEAIGKPLAVRAVGGANNANPLPIFIPCHRVVGSTGKLTGYSGGLDIKEKLLLLESRTETPKTQEP